MFSYITYTFSCLKSAFPPISTQMFAIQQKCTHSNGRGSDPLLLLSPPPSSSSSGAGCSHLDMGHTISPPICSMAATTKLSSTVCCYPLCSFYTNLTVKQSTGGQRVQAVPFQCERNQTDIPVCTSHQDRQFLTEDYYANPKLFTCRAPLPF